MAAVAVGKLVPADAAVARSTTTTAPGTAVAIIRALIIMVAANLLTPALPGILHLLTRLLNCLPTVSSRTVRRQRMGTLPSKYGKLLRP
jgi:hypothetical protein